MVETAGGEMSSREIAPAEPVWIEILSRHGDVVARHRCVAGEMRVGRAYDNDIVLDDPYVAARHLRIFRDERGDWIAEDLGSVNGLFADRGKRRQQRVHLDGDRSVRIGHTSLRIRGSSHQVPPERVTERSTRALFIALSLAVVVLGLEALGLWLQETAEPRLPRYLLPLLTLPLIVAAWTAFWAVMSRIFSGQARFERHLLIAISAVLAFSLYDEIGGFLAFAGSWPAVTTYDYLGTWVVLAVACFFHLREVGFSHLGLKAGLVGALMVVGIAIQSLSQFDGRDYQPRREVRFYPPALRIAPLRSEAAFLSEMGRVKGRLDRDRLETPGAGFGLLFGDEDDD